MDAGKRHGWCSLLPSFTDQLVQESIMTSIVRTSNAEFAQISELLVSFRRSRQLWALATVC